MSFIFAFVLSLGLCFMPHAKGQKINEAPSLKKEAFKVDLVVFSYERPLQLLAFLESLEKRVTGLNNTYILYRSDNADFEVAYNKLQQLFPEVRFCRQTGNPYQTFKPMLLDIMFKQSTTDYVLFGVDDIIVTREVDLTACARALKQYDAYGFYLRLGKNITQCYTLSIEDDFALPQLNEVESGVFSWVFKESLYDWNFPNSADMTIFNKASITDALHNLDYFTPNTLDTVWDRDAHVVREGKGSVRDRIGLCYEHSMMINLPLNIVQENKLDRNMEFFTTKELLQEFNDGFGFDIDKVYKFENKAPHTHYIPDFKINERLTSSNNDQKT